MNAVVISDTFVAPKIIFGLIKKIHFFFVFFCKKKFSQLVGFEPTRAEPNWFRVNRLNHSATTAGYEK